VVNGLRTGGVDVAVEARAGKAGRWARRTVVLTPEQAAWLEERARRDHSSVSAVVRRAIDALAVYLERVG
jgi:hypothetical protein